jgi:A/G-specific adenine glycosylase
MRKNKEPQLTAIQFQKAVLTWFKKNGRKNLPWQLAITPYRVWVSEIMLQQTQVTTVIPYFERFMNEFPTIEKLASADADHVMHLWTGLGYYSRARNLHKTAKIITTDLQGQFPNTLEALSALPGIGRSTAAAIISIAFNKRATILDGNVKRVLSRYIGIDQWPGNKAIEQQLWKVAEFYTPQKQCREYTQVMMDLGATLCTRTKPACHECPLQASCVAFASGEPEKFPGKKATKALPIKKGFMLVLYKSDGTILLEQRPPVGLWGGLWCLPEYSAEFENINEWCKKQYGLEIGKLNAGIGFRHTFSHFHYDISPLHALVKKDVLRISEQKTFLWYDLDNPAKIGLAKPIQSILSEIKMNAA